MRIKIAGSGASQSIPTYLCGCETCKEARRRSQRRRQSMVTIEVDGSLYLMDCGFDPLITGVISSEQTVSGIFISHAHLDHVYGLFSPNWRKECGEKIPVYHALSTLLNGDSLDVDLLGRFMDYQAPQNRFEFQAVEAWDRITLPGLIVTCYPLQHQKTDQVYYSSGAWGYLFQSSDGSLAYLSDTCGADQRVVDFLEEKAVDAMVIDSTFGTQQARDGHNNFQSALQLVKEIAPKKAWLTHFNHDGLDLTVFDKLVKELGLDPERVLIGADGTTWETNQD